MRLSQLIRETFRNDQEKHDDLDRSASRLSDARADAEAVACFQAMRKHFAEIQSETFANCLKLTDLVLQLPSEDVQLEAIRNLVREYKNDPA